METNIQQQSNKKRKTILIGMGAAVTGVLGYFGWQYFKKKKITEMDTDMVDLPASPSTPKKNTVVKRNDNFPLKRGSRGANVIALQQALIAQHGTSILPKYGADGDFGPELEDALKKANLPTTVNQTTFSTVTTPAGTKASAPPSADLNARQVATEIYQAIIRKDMKAALVPLKKMNSTQDYSAVSTAFQSYRVNGVKQTLVNGLLNTFKTAEQKPQIQMEFVRMGLKYDGSKWALSGLPGLSLITTAATTVWKNQTTPIKVATRTVLGKEVTRRNQHVVFENNGIKFLVKERDVTYLTA